MIRLNGRGAVYGELWFDEEPRADCAADIVQYRYRSAPVADSRATTFLTLLSDLAAGEDAIAGRFGKDCRYKVRRAETKDGLRVEFTADPAGWLDEFRAFFDAFAAQKSVAPCDQRWLAAACKAGQLALSSASKDGETLVWHATVVCGKTAGLQYTGSCFRDRDNDYRALVGRANRWLHWKDMLRLREMGIERYDWGGLFEDESAPERAGINKFKKDFGGQPVRVYDCTVPVSMKGRLYLPLRDAWRRVRLPAQHDSVLRPQRQLADR
jgi:lipid II:glycine glycyltransferase (peptidoglycan interpeptide bridge formation enzyme)